MDSKKGKQKRSERPEVAKEKRKNKTEFLGRNYSALDPTLD